MHKHMVIPNHLSMCKDLVYHHPIETTVFFLVGVAWCFRFLVGNITSLTAKNLPIRQLDLHLVASIFQGIHRLRTRSFGEGKAGFWCTHGIPITDSHGDERYIYPDENHKNQPFM